MAPSGGEGLSKVMGWDGIEFCFNHHDLVVNFLRELVIEHRGTIIGNDHILETEKGCEIDRIRPSFK